MLWKSWLEMLWGKWNVILSILWSLVHFSKILHFVKIMEIVFFTRFVPCDFLQCLSLKIFYSFSNHSRHSSFWWCGDWLKWNMWLLFYWEIWHFIINYYYGEISASGLNTHTLKNILCVGNSLCVPFLLIEWLIIFLLMIYISIYP